MSIRSGLWLLLLAVGCASGGPDVASAPPASGESVVFGSITVGGELLTAANSEVVVVNRDSGEVVSTEEVGEFAWNLPPGKYAIERYRERRVVFLGIAGQSSSQRIRLRGEFDVPSTPTAVYIGTLDVSMDETLKVTRKVLDEYDVAWSRLEGKLPTDLAGPEKSLMVLGR